VLVELAGIPGPIAAIFDPGDLIRSVAGGVGKASFSPIVVRHSYDASSPALARAAAVGQVLRSATITFLTGEQRTARIRQVAAFIVGDKQHVPDSQAKDAVAARCR
jgi:hypothetical protein